VLFCCDSDKDDKLWAEAADWMSEMGRIAGIFREPWLGKYASQKEIIQTYR
jgi:hypothetical protein